MTPETGRQCSLCGYVLDEQGRPARIPTRGCWVAHASCLASLPDGGRSVQGSCVETPGGLLPRGDAESQADDPVFLARGGLRAFPPEEVSCPAAGGIPCADPECVRRGCIEQGGDA